MYLFSSIDDSSLTHLFLSIPQTISIHRSIDHSFFQTGLSPLQPGQWKPFLGLYAGFYAVNSLLKPVRLVVALSVAPHTESLLQSLQQTTGDSRKAAVGCGIALLATTSAAMMATGIGLASVSSGVPLLS